MKFEEEAMGRKYYPFFFQILDEGGKPIYISKVFGELGYRINHEVLTHAKERKETREKFFSSKRRTPYRIISTPLIRVERHFKSFKLEPIFTF